MKKFGLFAAGVLLGTAGIKVLSSKDAKRVYTHTTAAVLRAKDSVMETVTTVRENAEDIYADAKAILREVSHFLLLLSFNKPSWRVNSSSNISLFLAGR